MPTNPETVEDDLATLLMHHLGTFTEAEKCVVHKWTALVVMRRWMQSSEFAADIELLRQLNVR